MAEITQISGTDDKLNDTGGAKFVPANKVSEEAEKLRIKRELPKPPGSVITRLKDLTDWIALLNDEMCERLMIYVYRHAPIINRQFVNPEADNNIDVISGDGVRNLSEEYFIERHGGGTYGLTIVDTDIVNRKKGSKGFFDCRFSINQTQYPPKLDYREVDWTNDKNKGYFAWARAQRIVDNNGQLMEPGKKPDTNTNGGGTTNQPENAVAIMKATMDMVSKLNESQQRDLKRTIGGEDAVNKPMTELLIAKMKEDSPNNVMPLLTTLLPLMMKQNTPVAPSGDGGFTAIATMMGTMMTAFMKSSSDTMMMMQESNKNTMTLLTTMFANQGKGEDSGEQFKQMVEIAKMIKGAPAPETTIGEKAIEALLGVASPIANIIQNVTAIKAGQIGMPQGTPTGGGNVRGNLLGNPVQTPVSAQQAPPSGTNVRANSQTLTEDFSNGSTPTPGVSQSDQAIILTVQQYGGMILQALNAGKEGWEYAEQVADMFGDIVVQTVAKHGTDNLIRGMKLVPEFWTVIENSYGEPHMKKWCDEFINYKKIVAEMESDGDGEEVEEIVEEGKEKVQ